VVKGAAEEHEGLSIPRPLVRPNVVFAGECLDHVIIFDEASLRRTLRSYFRYYHRSRLHLSLDKDSPDPRLVQSIGKVIAIPEVGGLHHRYERRAA